MAEGATADRYKVGKGGKVNIREKLAEKLLDLVVKCETRLIHGLSPKVQRQIGHEPYTWQTIPTYLRFFWLEQADQQIAIFERMLDTMEKKITPYESDEFCVDWKHNFLATSMAEAYRQGQQDLIKAIKELLKVKQ